MLDEHKMSWVQYYYGNMAEVMRSVTSNISSWRVMTLVQTSSSRANVT